MCHSANTERKVLTRVSTLYSLTPRRRRSTLILRGLRSFTVFVGSLLSSGLPSLVLCNSLLFVLSPRFFISTPHLLTIDPAGFVHLPSAHRSCRQHRCPHHSRETHLYLRREIQRVALALSFRVCCAALPPGCRWSRCVA